MVDVSGSVSARNLNCRHSHLTSADAIVIVSLLCSARQGTIVYQDTANLMFSNGHNA